MEEVAVHIPLSGLIIPDHINFSYYITVEKDCLRNKACLVLHGFPGSKSGYTTTTPSTETFISLKGHCSDPFACSLVASRIMSLATAGQRPSEAAHHSLPPGPFTTCQLASLRPP